MVPSVPKSRQTYLLNLMGSLKRVMQNA